MSEVRTYRELRDYLNGLTDAQLDQPIQVVEPSPSSEAVLLPVLAVGTIAEMEFDYARSSVDNRYHAEEVVLLADHNGFGKDGAIAYEYAAGEKIDMRKGKHIYGAGGKTPKSEQQSPGARERWSRILAGQHEETASEVVILKHRIEGHDAKSTGAGARS